MYVGYMVIVRHYYVWFMESFKIESCIQDFQIYMDIWS